MFGRYLRGNLWARQWSTASDKVTRIPSIVLPVASATSSSFPTRTRDLKQPKTDRQAGDGGRSDKSRSNQ